MIVAKNVKAADQIWIALTLLLKEHPERKDISRKEIIGKVLQEFGQVHAPATISAHISGHCVASKPPSPERHRMLTSEHRGKYHLFRPGEECHPERDRGKTMPSAEEIPPRYLYLLAWYSSEYCAPAIVFGPDALLLRIKPGASGRSDVSANHDRYLADASRESRESAGNVFTH